ncbi:MAG: hypothetical protein RLZZ283_173 [Candidatus Parcubacteria bacterium]|jgi:hypothetical protein
MQVKFEYMPGSGLHVGVGKFIVLQKEGGKSQKKSITVRAGLYMYHRDIPVEFGKKEGGLVGAGTFDREAQVTSWSSEGYGIDTPVQLQKPIQDAFTAKQKAIASDAW